MPTIVLARDGETIHHIRGFDEFGGTDDFTTEDVAFVLANHNVLKFEVDRYARMLITMYAKFLIGRTSSDRKASRSDLNGGG